MTFAWFTKTDNTAPAVHGAVRDVLMHGARV